MNWRVTLALFVILVIAAAAVFLWQQQPAATPTPTISAFSTFIEAADLYDGLVIEDVQRVEVSRADPPAESVFVQSEDGAWMQTVPTTTQVISFTVSNQVMGMLNSRSRRALMPEGGDLAAFGLAEPHATILIAARRDEDTVRYQIAIGSTAPGGNIYYVHKSGDPRVHLVNKFALDSILRLLDDPPVE